MSSRDHLVASKEATFIKTAFGSLDASGEITLHKLDLNFLYQVGSCFFRLVHLRRKATCQEAPSSWLERQCNICCLLLLHCAVRFLLLKYRETQSDWSVKCGISQDISVVARKMNGVFETQTFVHIVHNTSQKWKICLYQQQILAVIP